MSPELALKLVSILEAYFSRKEVGELAALFEAPFDTLDLYVADQSWSWLPLARELVEKLEHGNYRRLLDSLLDLADTRNTDGIAHTSWERQSFHQDMAMVLREARKLLEASGAPSEIAAGAGQVFSAKSKVRELLETSTGDILIVDPYVGLGTLDCLRSLTVSVRVLTGTLPNSIEPGFERAVAAFQAEGHQLQVRRAAQLHDRHIVFNGRCWLVGGSLKDAGKKPFNCIEIIDQKTEVVAGLEAKWAAGTPFP